MTETGQDQQVDPRVVQTKKNLRSALERLIKSHDPNKISVSALCKEAGVSRPTFYQHYSSIFDLYGAAVMDKLAEFEPGLFDTLQHPGNPVNAIASVIGYLDDNRTAILSIMDTNVMRFGAGELVRGWLDQRLAKVHFHAQVDELTPEQADQVTFTTNGILGLVFKRLRQTQPEASPEEFATHALRLVVASMRLAPGAPIPEEQTGSFPYGTDL
jgi:AcrR family transcriptional regulator